jgi:hypothetical protein
MGIETVLENTPDYVVKWAVRVMRTQRLLSRNRWNYSRVGRGRNWNFYQGIDSLMIKGGWK